MGYGFLIFDSKEIAIKFYKIMSKTDTTIFKLNYSSYNDRKKLK